MPLKVCTSRIPHHNLPGYRGPHGFNVTRRGGGAAADPFAPSDALLSAGLKAKRQAKKDEAALALVFEWYALLYREEMRESYRAHRRAWEELLHREHVVLLCYCGHHERCHRSELAEILVKLGATYEGEITS